MHSEYNINGTLIWYYYICKREVWLMSRAIIPEQDDTNIDYGRFIHENSYNREREEIVINNNKIDRIKFQGNKIIITEIKKTSKYLESSKMQLLHYLYELDKSGVINCIGKIKVPTEKKNL